MLHITFSRLLLRPIESYDHLGEEWLSDKPYDLRVLLGREDFLDTRGGAISAHTMLRLGRTMAWGKS